MKGDLQSLAKIVKQTITIFSFFVIFRIFVFLITVLFSDCLLLFGSRATPKIQRHFRRQRENGHFGRFWTQLESVQDSKIFRLRLSRTPQRFFTRQRVHSRGQIHRTQGDFYFNLLLFLQLIFFVFFPFPLFSFFNHFCFFLFVVGFFFFLFVSFFFFFVFIL